MLPDKLPKVRKWTFNIEPQWLEDAPIQRLSMIGNQLVESAGRWEEAHCRRAHSLSGLVVAEELNAMRVGIRLEYVLDSIVGAVFSGTPF
jgi:hypothetical protein